MYVCLGILELFRRLFHINALYWSCQLECIIWWGFSMIVIGVCISACVCVYIYIYIICVSVRLQAGHRTRNLRKCWLTLMDLNSANCVFECACVYNDLSFSYLYITSCDIFSVSVFVTSFMYIYKLCALKQILCPFLSCCAGSDAKNISNI
jgi:hypothetical protein